MSGKHRSRLCACCGKAPPNGKSFGWCNRHKEKVTLCPDCLGNGCCGCGPGNAEDGSETPTQEMPPLQTSQASSQDSFALPADLQQTTAVLVDLLGIGTGHLPDGRPWIGLHVMTEHGPRMIQLSYRHAMMAARDIKHLAGELQARDNVN